MAVRMQTNMPVALSFPYGDFMEVEGQYGPQFLYTVELEGQRDRLYATPRLHELLQALPVGPGSVVAITRVEGEGHRRDWLVEKGGNGRASERAEPEEAAGEPAPEGGPTFAGMEALMRHCLRASWRTWQGLEEGSSFTSEDVRATGITLFLECARKGIATAPAEEAVPA